MALSQAASLVERVLGHDTNATTEQDITNPGRDRAKYADPSGETMKALCWMGKNDVKVRTSDHSPLPFSRFLSLRIISSHSCN